MSEEGIRLQLSGKKFKLDLSQIICGVLESAAKTLVAVKTGSVSLALAPNLITGFFSALKGFKLDETPELRAWLLVSGGLLYSLEKAVGEMTFVVEPTPAAFRQLIDDLAERVRTRIYIIESDFFATPNNLELLDDAAHELSAWASQFGSTETPKSSIEKIEKYFPTGLHRTWVKDADRFQPIEKAINSPFTEAIRRRQECDGYLQYLEEQYTDLRLIGQDDNDPAAVKLSQVFVPLRAFNEEVPLDQQQSRQVTNSELGINGVGKAIKIKRKVVQFFDALDIWVSSRERRDQFRIISGGPGIGKSSSMRAYATRIARNEKAYPILIPLQKLDRQEQPLRDRIREYLVNHRDIPFTENPLEYDELISSPSPILLIFDGLDELVRPGKDADEIAREFVTDLRTLLDQVNGHGGGHKVIAVVTGRIAAAGSAARALKCSGEQVLFLLRFAENTAPNEGDREPYEFVDDQMLLAEDQRKTWWDLWRAAASGVPATIPEYLIGQDLLDVTSEPLLLYFVALVRPWETGELALGSFRNKLYDRLLRRFFDREGTEGGLNFATEFQTFEDYEVALQAMALAAWYDGSTRTGTIELVEKLLNDWDRELVGIFRSVIGGNKPAIGAALAFYMKPGERPNSFEFLHKTFAEYLVARRIVEFIRECAEIFHEQADGRMRKGRSFDAAEYLKRWLILTGPRPVDIDLAQFLRDTFDESFRIKAGLIREWRTMIVHWISICIEHGLPAHELFHIRDDQVVRRPQSFREAVDQARNAEEMLFMALNCTIRPELYHDGFVPVEIQQERSPLRNVMRNLLRRLGAKENLDHRVFDGLSFAGEWLTVQDMALLHGRKADFSGANLLGAGFLHAELEGSKFCSAEISQASFWYAALAMSDLARVNAKEAVFKEARMTNADLSGGNFAGADFRRARLQKVEASQANCSGANFENARLEGAKLRGANLKGANFRAADLSGADLEGADVDEADFRGAQLVATNLMVLNFDKANFEGAKMDRAVVPRGDVGV